MSRDDTERKPKGGNYIIMSAQRCLLFKSCLVALGLIIASVAVAAPIKVAVYKGHGSQAVLNALKEDSSIQAVMLKNITADELMQYDVLYIGGGAFEQPNLIRDIKTFVHCGGGLILTHSACGRNRPETIFPSIVSKVVDRREDSILRVKDASHPLSAGLPQEFEHAYTDHLYLAAGPDGVVVLIDSEGADAAVAGPVGAGRVVFNGALSGYWYNPADFRQGDKEPEGAELQWVLNTIKWAAGDKRLSSLAAEELSARRQQAETEIKYAELAAYTPNADWFGHEMLYGSYLAFPPVTEIGGRFFITYDAMSWRNSYWGVRNWTDPAAREFYLNRLRLDVKQLKWLGITDIVYWVDMMGDRVWRETSVPDSVNYQPGIDGLAELIKFATPEGLNVWSAWHSCARNAKEFAEKYGARDAAGNLYIYDGKDYVEDLLNPAVLDRCKMMLDEYADKYVPMGNFKGLYSFDELWFTYADFHGDDLEAIDKFCRERFGEPLPDDFAQKLALRRNWQAHDDPWRRRYILFKQKVMTDFYRELLTHAHKRGLQMGVTPIYEPSRWYLGMDNPALARLGGDFLLGYFGAASDGYSNSFMWSHVYSTWGHYTTANLLGRMGGGLFTFNHLWRLIMYGNDPRYAQEFARHVYTIRMFADSQPLARVAVLENQQALEMLTPTPRVAWSRLKALYNTAQRGQYVHRIYSQASELFQNYRVLVVDTYGVRCLPAETQSALRSFVEQGGIVVAADADWSSSREDMEEEKNCTAAMAGVVYDTAAPTAAVNFEWQGQKIALTPATPRRVARPDAETVVLAEFSDGTPAVTEKTIGKGKVVALHFDAGAELSRPMGNSALASAFIASLEEYAQPPVKAVAGEGVELRSALKKGNWVAVALFPKQPPTKLTLHVDLAALGIEKKAFRLLMLGKQMEITRPGDLLGSSGFWTPEELKQGFTVSLPVDNRSHLPLPENFDLSEFKNKRDAEYLNKTTRGWWDSERRGKRKRDYAHEVVVIAPADEPFMPQ